MIKTLKIRIISISAALVLLVSVIGGIFLAGRKESNTRSSYHIAAEIVEERLSGQMELKYVNNNALSVEELYFCLYPNAFKYEENVNNVAVADLMAQAYPRGFDSGWIEIKNVSVEGKEVDFFLEQNEQILRVATGSIKPGREKDISITFEEKLPYSPMRYGYGENTFNFCNWYPVLCPFENGQPVTCTYVANGDPFYSECADYTVSITASSLCRLASSGMILSQDTSNPLRTKWTVEGKNIRDFAFVLSEDFALKSRQVGDTIVYSYFLKGDEAGGDNALKYACAAVECFNQKFGLYPYGTLSVVSSDFYIGGMEYPNMVLINQEFYRGDKEEALEEVVVHEVAHQWWYGLVGSNEIREPWLDEGLTQYSVALYYEACYGPEMYQRFLHDSETYCKVVFDVVKNVNGTVTKNIERASNEFEHWLLYDAVTYDATAIMLDALRNAIGEENFERGLKNYFTCNQYKNAAKEDFIEDFTAGAGKDVGSFLEPWLRGEIYWG